MRVSKRARCCLLLDVGIVVPDRLEGLPEDAERLENKVAPKIAGSTRCGSNGS